MSATALQYRFSPSDRVSIVAQVDRFSGAFDSNGNWTSTKRFYVTQDDDLQRVGSQLVADLGEVDMSHGDTLVDFVTWAMDTFPADRQVLILSDHGMGGSQQRHVAFWAWHPAGPCLRYEERSTRH